MIRLLSRMGPALLLATGVIAAEVLGSAPAAGLWRLAAPALLVLTLVTADLLRTRLLGGPMRVSSPALILGVAILLAGTAIASQDLAGLAAWVPLFGCCAAASLFLRRDEKAPCPLA